MPRDQMRAPLFFYTDVNFQTLRDPQIPNAAESLTLNVFSQHPVPLMQPHT